MTHFVLKTPLNSNQQTSKPAALLVYYLLT